MSDTDPSDDRVLNVQEPGTAATAAGDGEAQSSDDNEYAVQIESLKADVKQRDLIIAELNAQLQGMATVPSSPKQPAGVARIIGEDWSSKTTAEAMAAGVDRIVLCSDGYHVPG